MKRDSIKNNEAHGKEVPSERHDLRILRSLRRIIRFTEIHSRYLASEYKITGPQLVCLTTIMHHKRLSVSELANKMYLSASTVVGILDRLEERNLIKRERSKTDRRLVEVSLENDGKKLLKKAPSPLQEKLHSALLELAKDEQETIALSLERVVELMEAKDLAAPPMVDAGKLDLSAEGKILISKVEELSK